ncbi:MAG: CapA family protein [Butyrivibrio sp.]|nr:CapA family protein [Butyrivibrio sp.]
MTLACVAAFFATSNISLAMDSAQNGRVVITAVGDCTLGNDEQVEWKSNSFHKVYNENGADYFFQNVRELFRKDDLTIVNLECVLTNLGERQANKDWCFRSDPSYLNILTGSSVEAVSFANNHCRDYGEISYTDTLNNLKNYGIPCSSENSTLVMTINNVKVGLISIQAAYRSSDEDKDKEYYDTEELLRLTDTCIEDVKAKGAKLIIMNYHWGIERTSKITTQQKTLGHYAVDKGCNLVIGHHPHILQPVEVYKDTYIIYSLGNFCFGGNTNPKDKDTIIWQQSFKVSGENVICDYAKIYPCSISSSQSLNDYCPLILSGSRGQKIINRMNSLSGSYGIEFDENGILYIK